MAISKVNIINLALIKVGARGTIADIEELSPNGETMLNLWDIVFQRVLSERDWKFAKTRIEIQKSTLTPIYGYQYAYIVPSDFIRLVRTKNPESRGINPVADPHGGYLDCNTLGYPFMYDAPVWPPGFPYVFETMLDTDGNATKCMLTDYDNSTNPLMINYIRLITDMGLLTPAFIEALAIALASEAAMPIKEDKELAFALKQEYLNSLNTAEAFNEQADYLAEEAGSTSWVDAGR